MSVESLPFTPARELPNGKLFHSPLGIFEFQADHLAELYMRTEPDQDGGALAVWDTGIGKTVLALLLSTYLYEDDQIDLVMVICEQNKVREWKADFDRFTALSSVRYHSAGRQKRLEKAGTPHVIVTAYETGRAELMERQKTGARGPGKAVDGPLVDALGLRDKRVLWVFDEPIKLKNRSSALYQSYEYILRSLRRGSHHQRVVGLTATPMDTNIEQAFNIARLICPELMPSVGQFEEWFTYGRDDFGRYRIIHGKKQVFGHLFQRMIIRKRKTDPDVIEQFPKLIEESDFVPMAKDQREFYQAVMTLLDPPEGADEHRTDEQIVMDEKRIRRLLRMTAGHPASHLHVPNPLSKAIVEVKGEAWLRSVSSAKTARLIERLTLLVKGQGAQVIVFEYFTSVITEVVRELREAGFTVGEYHGRVDDGERERQKKAFKSGEIEVLFLSDAGARGINLQNAQYVIEYSSATAYSNRVQRLNRNNRIDSDLPSTTATTMVMEGTVEEDIFASTIDRNKDLDTLVGDEEDDTGFISADQRRALLAAYRKRRGVSEPSTEETAA